MELRITKAQPTTVRHDEWPVCGDWCNNRAKFKVMDGSEDPVFVCRPHLADLVEEYNGHFALSELREEG